MLSRLTIIFNIFDLTDCYFKIFIVSTVWVHVGQCGNQLGSEFWKHIIADPETWAKRCWQSVTYILINYLFQFLCSLTVVMHLERWMANAGLFLLIPN